MPIFGIWGNHQYYAVQRGIERNSLSRLANPQAVRGGLENNELALALASILPQKEDISEPRTAVGIVTHVDSRTKDYFDGVQHHHNESHDYITVNSGDTHLTVWLPGEADRFSVGDHVTVTYNGEPATAYNIWPGQLVSVE